MLNKIKLDPILTGNWQYEGKYIPAARGGYRIKVVASNPQNKEAKPMESKEIYFDVRDTSLEFSNVTLNETGMTSLASTSGGKYYKPVEVLSKINKDITRAGIIWIQVDRDLWDNPWFWGLVVALFGVEWVWRKTKGLI